MSLSLTLIPLAIGAVSAVSYALEEKIEQGEFYRIDTQMKDEDIISEALNNYGCDVSLNEEQFQTSIGEIELAFQQQQDGTFSAVFNQFVSVDDAKNFLTNIQKEYVRIVQKQSYEKLLNRAKQEGLQLQKEQTGEDDSIVLTFEVKENLNYER